MTDLRQLPLSDSNFRKIRTQDYLYIDKTELLYKLIKGPASYCLLTRPRRFGKSLLVSTLEELFLGRGILAALILLLKQMIAFLFSNSNITSPQAKRLSK